MRRSSSQEKDPQHQKARSISTNDTNHYDFQDDLLIWIDAICINQSDGFEKSWQVAQMGDLYKNAAETFIFLGTSNEYSDAAIDFFARLSTIAIDLGLFRDYTTFLKSLESATRSLQKGNLELMLVTPGSFEDLVFAIVSRNGSDPHQPTFFGLLSALMNRPWWLRIWTLQEYVLSPSPLFVCGCKSFRQYELFPVLRFYHSINLAIDVAKPGDMWDLAQKQIAQCFRAGYSMYPGTIVMPRDYGSNPRGGACSYAHLMTFDRIMNFTLQDPSQGHNLRATDPRDIIYGLLGLVGDWKDGQRQIKPDYTLDCAQVYASTALALLEGGLNKVLRWALNLSSERDLPSWVPDWSKGAYNQGVLRLPDDDVVENIVLRESYMDGKHILTLPGQAYTSIRRLGCSKLMGIAGANKLSSTKSLAEESVTVMVPYLSRLVSTLRHSFPREDALDKQLFMLNIALGLQLGFPFDSIETVKQLWSEHPDQPDFDPNGHDRRGFDRTWNRAITMMKVMRNSGMLSSSALWSLSYAARMELCFVSIPTDTKDKTMQRLGRAWKYFYLTLSKNQPFEPFVANGVCTGVTSKAVVDGDMLVRFDMDPTAMFVIRPAGDGLWELVSAACVPQQWLDDDFPGGETREFSLC